MNSPSSTTVVTTAVSSPGLVTNPVSPVQPGSTTTSTTVASASLPVYTNGTTVVTTSHKTSNSAGGGSSGSATRVPGTPSGTSPVSSTSTGAANNVFVASGAGLAGLVGLAAYFL